VLPSVAAEGPINAPVVVPEPKVESSVTPPFVPEPGSTSGNGAT
jgi:hypothetical protein